MNYHSLEANQHYMSASQYKSFISCEARTLAEIRGEWKTEPSQAILVGSYVDAHFSGEMEGFKEANPGIFKRDGTLRSEYEQADYIIRRIESDRLFNMMMEGQSQVVLTGYIADVPFKAKLDVLLDEDKVSDIVKAFPETRDWFGFGDGAIVDLKVMRSFEPIWTGTAKAPFVSAWGYDIQGAIYRHLQGEELPFFIAAATKESETDLAVIGIPAQELDAKLAEVEELAPRFQEIKLARIEPTRCEKCDYCRKTRKLNTIIDFREV